MCLDGRAQLRSYIKDFELSAQLMLNTRRRSHDCQDRQSPERWLLALGGTKYEIKL